MVKHAACERALGVVCGWVLVARTQPSPERLVDTGRDCREPPGHRFPKFVR
jgi:hypothetical protein